MDAIGFMTTRAAAGPEPTTVRVSKARMALQLFALMLVSMLCAVALKV